MRIWKLPIYDAEFNPEIMTSEHINYCLTKELKKRVLNLHSFLEQATKRIALSVKFALNNIIEQQFTNGKREFVVKTESIFFLNNESCTHGLVRTYNFDNLRHI